MRLVISSGIDALSKAGPFVGPRGGLWADPKHTVHWEPSRHGTERIEAMLADLVPNDKVKGVAESISQLTPAKLAALARDLDAKIETISSRGEAVPTNLMRWWRIINEARKPASAARQKPKTAIAAARATNPREPEKKTAPAQLDLVLAAPQKKADAGKEPGEKVRLSLPRESITTPKEEKPKALIEVGEHIWGSRKDLADTARKIQSGEKTLGADDIASMSYDDAAYLVTKQTLIPPHDLEILKGLGHTPGAAHLALALMTFIKAKPADTKQARDAYVDDVRVVLAGIRGATAEDDIRSLVDEWSYRFKRAPKWEPVSKVGPGTEGAEAAKKLVEKLTKETGVEHALTYSYTSGRQVSRKAMRPFESLGARFVALLNKPLSNKLWRQARKEAQAAQAAPDGWSYLNERGTAASADLVKRRQKEARHGKTKRGFSEAALYQGIAGTVDRSGHTVEVPDANPERIANTFGLKNIDYGQEGYMTQADREHHTKMFEGAMHDFSEILGVDPSTMSLNGRLGVAFGARGRGTAKAHYEPGRKVINITKFSGGGSLAHEWGHALDNVMAGLFGSNTRGRSAGVFLSENPSSSSYPPRVRAALEATMTAITKHPDPAAARAAHAKRLRELEGEVNKAIRASNELVKEANTLKEKPATKDDLDRAIAGHEKRIKRYETEIKDLEAKARGKKPGRAMSQEIYNRQYWIKNGRKKIEKLRAGGTRTHDDQIRLDALALHIDDARLDINRKKNAAAKYRRIDPEASDFTAGGELMGKYWGSRVELFARAFESWIQDSLSEAGRKSDYLTGGVKTTRSIKTGHTLPSGDPAQPYPRGEERRRINVAMRNLIDTIKETGDIRKALLTIPIG